MLSSVLRSEDAILVSIRIMDVFVAMRRTLATLAPLLARIEETDRRQIADQMRNDANQARNEERFKLILDAMQFNAQYANSLTVKTSDKFHDRFLFIDKTTLIHIGASLNHLGKKCFRRR